VRGAGARLGCGFRPHFAQVVLLEALVRVRELERGDRRARELGVEALRALVALYLQLELRLDLTRRECGPVDAREELGGTARHTELVVWVSVQERFHELLAVIANSAAWETNAAEVNVLAHRLRVLVEEWSSAAAHLNRSTPSDQKRTNSLYPHSSSSTSGVG
jgi:hypothetical protein